MMVDDVYRELARRLDEIPNGFASTESGAKVEEKVRKGIRKWLDEPERGEGDWEEIGRKVEERIKRELKEWADE